VAAFDAHVTRNVHIPPSWCLERAVYRYNKAARFVAAGLRNDITNPIAYVAAIFCGAPNIPLYSLHEVMCARMCRLVEDARAAGYTETRVAAALRTLSMRYDKYDLDADTDAAAPYHERACGGPAVLRLLAAPLPYVISPSQLGRVCAQCPCPQPLFVERRVREVRRAFEGTRNATTLGTLLQDAGVRTINWQVLRDQMHYALRVLAALPSLHRCMACDNLDDDDDHDHRTADAFLLRGDAEREAFRGRMRDVAGIALRAHECAGPADLLGPGDFVRMAAWPRAALSPVLMDQAQLRLYAQYLSAGPLRRRAAVLRDLGGCGHLGFGISVTRATAAMRLLGMRYEAHEDRFYYSDGRRALMAYVYACGAVHVYGRASMAAAHAFVGDMRATLQGVCAGRDAPQAPGGATIQDAFAGARAAAGAGPDEPLLCPCLYEDCSAPDAASWWVRPGADFVVTYGVCSLDMGARIAVGRLMSHYGDPESHDARIMGVVSMRSAAAFGLHVRLLYWPHAVTAADCPRAIVFPVPSGNVDIKLDGAAVHSGTWARLDAFVRSLIGPFCE
jgi:hypothetical protein